jgi:histidyl-tRNA synthetase
VSYRGPKGTYDVFPQGREPYEKPELWTWIELVANDIFRRFNFTKVQLPIFEEANLFIRSVGEASDIVRKEMFLFYDKGNRQFALRPEGTASVVRSYIQRGLPKRAPFQKLWYFGPMFRYERQQKGRFRQHVQIGAEVLGSADPLVDVELISLLYHFHQVVGVRDEVFHLNNLGDVQTREAYIPELRAFFLRYRNELDADSLSRLDTNPLRILDSKDKRTQQILEQAPSIRHFLSPQASEHFKVVRQGLDVLRIPHVVDENLVRGLDYYTMTVFEAKSTALGAQDTVGAGGRYNGLVQELGGPDLPGIGFGTGVERILLAAQTPETGPSVDVFFVTLASEARLLALQLADALRSAGVSCDLDFGDRSSSAKFRQADRAGATWALIIGPDELETGVCRVRDMTTGEERTVSVVEGLEELLRALRA